MKYDYIIKEMQEPYNIKWLNALNKICNNSKKHGYADCAHVDCDECPFTWKNRKDKTICKFGNILLEDRAEFLYQYMSNIKKHIDISKLNI